MKNPTIATFAIALIWSVLVVLHFLARTISVLDEPHIGDLYSYSWGFQALAFLVWPFPVWMVILCAVLIIQLILMRHRNSELPDCEAKGSAALPSKKIQSERDATHNP